MTWNESLIAAAVYVGFYLLQLAVITRALLRPNREPSSRIAWIVVIAVLPGIGILAYLLFGETNIGRKRVERSRQAIAALPPPSIKQQPSDRPGPVPLPRNVRSLFRLGESVNGFKPVAGNTARLTADSNAAIDDMVADMDAAEDHIHLTFYIWLADNNGLKVVEALKRAAARGVTCRAMADGLGSRPMIASKHWRDLGKAGVHLGVALPIGNPLLRPFNGRIDLRNHRKILVIDNRITYCGSQNCADPEFRVKAKYAPWVDAMMRFEGPVALQNQLVFAADWMTSVDEDLSRIVPESIESPATGFPAQVIATGPTVRSSAMPEVFASLMYAATERLTITTPYYVPNELMQASLCAAANRGVDTTIIFPARNDSFIVAASSRSYYDDLLKAGVRIFEYREGLLHTKSMTVDDSITLIGSANMDRRSFDLNYENNILLYDAGLTSDMQKRQEAYLADSTPISLEDVEQWSLGRRLWNNTMAMLGPLL
jgi:cardiolipin synthase